MTSRHAAVVLLILCLVSPVRAFADTRVDVVRVSKSARKMYLLAQGQCLREYAIALGDHPLGHKQREGDGRTPEGRYILDHKNTASAFYKALHISYPNPDDIARATRAGVSPGGQIMIHGQKNGFSWLSGITQHFDWTQGCIAVTNAQMDEIWALVEVGTPIVIEP